MSNKTWNYVVVVIPPEEMGKKPLQRETKHIYVSATSAPRAQSKAIKEATDNGWERSSFIVLETMIDRDEERNAPDLPYGQDDEDDD